MNQGDTMINSKRDFSKGPVWKIILQQSVPLMLAQLVQLLYNVVDRIYIGHMNGDDSTALTGVGLTFPVITFIIAFAALFGMGGVPLFSIAVAAAEACVGLAMVILIFRNRESVDADTYSNMTG